MFQYTYSYPHYLWNLFQFPWSWLDVPMPGKVLNIIADSNGIVKVCQGMTNVCWIWFSSKNSTKQPRICSNQTPIWKNMLVKLDHFPKSWMNMKNILSCHHLENYLFQNFDVFPKAKPRQWLGWITTTPSNWEATKKAPGRWSCCFATSTPYLSESTSSFCGAGLL